MKLDPDHKECFPFYKKIRKISKLLQDAEDALENMKDYEACVESARHILTYEPDEQNVRFTAFHYLCKCYVGTTETTRAIDNCQEALKIRREPGVICDSAEAYLAADMFDDGNYTFVVVACVERNFSRSVSHIFLGTLLFFQIMVLVQI